MDGDVGGYDARRSMGHALRGGLRDVGRSPWQLAVTAVTVCVALFVVLLATTTSQLLDAGRVEVIRASTIVAVLDEGLDTEDIEVLEGELSRLSGLHSVRSAARQDLAEMRGGVRTGDLPEGLALVLSGSREPEEVLDVLGVLSGIKRAELAVGGESDLLFEMMSGIVPWLAGALILGGLLMVANLARVVAFDKIDEARTMRLLGAGRLAVFAALGLPVIVVVVGASALALAGFLGLYAGSARIWLSPVALEAIRLGRIVANGAVITAVAAAMAALASWTSLRRELSA